MTPHERIRSLLDQIDPYKSGAAAMAMAVEGIKAELAKIEDPGAVSGSQADEILREIRALRAEIAAERPRRVKAEA